ncbi:eclosion hormone [Penaeus vannamei]|uniref:eclosion hormone n=1 Tax=Penaeus vannamei TaxID=6689 RepID=UPI000F684F74|nr:eclosion hormone-like [Penaeus vannamei]XP_027227953.1 eclosion hormone-like [Penaeus vannamei]
MVSSRKVLQTALLVLRVLLVLVSLGVPPAADAAANKVTICIKNCAQCKLMYHDHFKGGLCAEFCLQVEGRFIPDCANPQDLIPFFLERLE